jgi:hypothetical protein
MKQIFLFSTIVFLCQPITLAAQQAKEIVVVMNRNYTYDDPRDGDEMVLAKGKAISVWNVPGGDYEYWPYPIGKVLIPKKAAHVLGTINGERYIVLNSAGVRLREGPSTQYGYYCVNSASGASVYHYKFVHDNKPLVDDWGLKADWTPYTLPKGTRLPYLGKQGNFYKTKFNGQVFYVSAKYSLLK